MMAGHFSLMTGYIDVTGLCQNIYMASQGRHLGWSFLFLSCFTDLGDLAAQVDYFVKGGIRIESINDQSW